MVGAGGAGHVGALMLVVKDLVQAQLFEVLDVVVAAVLPVAIGSPEVGEAVLGGLVVAHVPGAGVAEAVAGGLEGLAEGGDGFGQGGAVGEGADGGLPGDRGVVHHQLMLMGVAAGEHGGSGGGALGLGHVGVGELDATCGQAVDVGGVGEGVTVGADEVALELVAEEDEDVGMAVRSWPVAHETTPW